MDVGEGSAGRSGHGSRPNRILREPHLSWAFSWDGAVTEHRVARHRTYPGNRRWVVGTGRSALLTCAGLAQYPPTPAILPPGSSEDDSDDSSRCTP